MTSEQDTQTAGSGTDSGPQWGKRLLFL